MQTIELKKQMGKLHEEMPGVMKEGFDLLSEQVLKEGALSKKTKELITLSLGISALCEYCIRLHTPLAVRAGANRAEILEAAGVAMMMRGGPAVTYVATELLPLLDELKVE
ncbi:MAG: carboxymuconolactone decarboxylase family protein [Atribacterota bacterium]|jgi:AhpD family alkylhydroperoxidase|nr:carboxymuconolactone decarboxylase family protein [Atribacterota bacterium]MDD4896022.1 carboxymuconolactone decarboxylase family protein [Atribacterota bacterium]MDD5637607.1 carboxymuconolactone decarboxylase family protein [Atribacterota bacterium]